MKSPTPTFDYQPLRLRALSALLFGLAALAWRDVTLGEFVVLFGVFLFFNGVGALCSGIVGGHPAERWAFFVEGAVCLVLSGTTLAWPFIPVALLYTVATWGILTGTVELIAAARIPAGASRWLLRLAGVSSIFLGMVVMALPGAGSIAVVRVIGLYALGFSTVLFVVSLRVSEALPTPRRIAAE